ncbi:MAG: sensor histidine kinase [Cumulibacter sp.]
MTLLEIAVHTESDLSRLPTEVAADAYRLVQEAMNNVVKHAQARCIWVELSIEQTRRALVVNVVDDGVGFTPSGAGTGRSGLRGMCSRAARHGGDFQVRARTETPGTQVRAHFALDERVTARSA